MSIKHLLSYIVRGTFSEALQKVLEITTSNLKTERRTLQDILPDVFHRLLATITTYPCHNFVRSPLYCRY